MSDNIYDIKKPTVKDDKWIIFEDSIFENLDSFDCNDAISGQCYNDKTFEQCVDVCEKSPICDFGYYISDLKTSNICVPLYKQKNYSNPVYRLRNKDIYSEFKDARIKTFINQKEYPFPPKQGNNMFFMDNFNIQNVETGYWMNDSPMKKEYVVFSQKKDDIPLSVQAIRIPPGLSAESQYVTVKYGQKIAFNIPTTTFVLRESNDNTLRLKWINRITNLEDSDFEIHPILPDKNIGDNILYSDVFIIKSDDNILGIDDKSQITKLYYETYEKAKDKGRYVTFRFIPRMEGYYCNNDSVCTKISLQDMKVDKNGIGKIDGIPIGRNPGCWGMCKYGKQLKINDYNAKSGDKLGDKSFQLVSVMVVVIILIFICGFIIIKTKRR